MANGAFCIQKILARRYNHISSVDTRKQHQSNAQRDNVTRALAAKC